MQALAELLEASGGLVWGARSPSGWIRSSSCPVPVLQSVLNDPTVGETWNAGRKPFNDAAWEARQQGSRRWWSVSSANASAPSLTPSTPAFRTADLDQLELWGEQLLDATTLTDLFPEPHNPTTPHT